MRSSFGPIVLGSHTQKYLMVGTTWIRGRERIKTPAAAQMTSYRTGAGERYMLVRHAVMRGEPVCGEGGLMKCYKAGWGALSALVLAASLAGCGQVQTAGGGMPTAQTERFTSVHIALAQKAALTTTSFKPRDITNRHTVNTLYRDIRALKPFPTGPISCPADRGIDYILKFHRGRRVVLTAKADPTGCSEVRLSTGRDLWAAGHRGQAFWRALAHAPGENVGNLQ